MSSTAGTAEEGPSRAGRLVVVAGLALAAVAAIGVLGVFRFVESERERDLRAWQVRLGIVADSRAAAVADWLADQHGALRELAENASLQLYLTELALARGDRAGVTEEAAQAEYLRNLLVATADRTGFAAPPLGPQVQANVERVGIAGMSIVDPAGRPLVSTPGMPPLTDRLQALLAQTPLAEPGASPLHQGAGGQSSMALVAPVFAVQGGEDASDVVGRIVGLRIVGEDLFDRLRQPGDIEQTAETMLVRREGGTVSYLSPLRDGTPPLRRALALDTAELAAARLLESPGGFGIFRDYRGSEVLATSRAIAGIDWTLVRKIDRAEALGETDRRLATLLTVLLLAIGVALAAIVAVWRHGTSVRAALAAERFRISTERFQNLTKFLRVVTDGQPNEIVAVDADQRYTFANRRAAEAAGLAPEEMLGKTMAAVIGPARAGPYEAVNRQVLERFQQHSQTHGFADADGRRRVLKSDHIPLRGDRDHPPGVLMIVEDITELVDERERATRIMRQLVDTLVNLVDRRDPFSAHHSARVAAVGRAIAEEMDLPEAERETVDIAGSLLNLGKVLVPRDLLTRQSALAEDELRQVRESMLAGAELLRGVDFAGPVVETLRQSQAHWDGSGVPAGLAGEAILRTARIVAVANAFVGMVSARSHRPGLGFDEAARRLMDGAGRVYDRAAVAALLNRLDNRGGHAEWADFAEPPAPAAG